MNELISSFKWVANIHHFVVLIVQEQFKTYWLSRKWILSWYMKFVLFMFSYDAKNYSYESKFHFLTSGFCMAILQCCWHSVVQIVWHIFTSEHQAMETVQFCVCKALAIKLLCKHRLRFAFYMFHLHCFLMLLVSEVSKLRSSGSIQNVRADTIASYQNQSSACDENSRKFIICENMRVISFQNRYFHDENVFFFSYPQI